MKNLLPFSIALLFISFSVTSQEKLNKLKAPSSPAANILDLQPTAILTPKSYQALETALFSNFIGNSGSVQVPNDFALEFSPFWAFEHNPITIEEYLYPKKIWNQIARNSSISLASTQNFELGNNTQSNAISLGYRTSIYFTNDEDKKKVAKSISNIRDNKSITTAVVAILDGKILNGDITNNTQAIEAAKTELTKALQNSNKFKDPSAIEKVVDKIVHSLPTFDSNNPDKFTDAIDNSIREETNAELVFSQFKAYTKERSGMYFDFAFAALMNFPNKEFSRSYIPKVSLWLTPRYKVKSEIESLNFLGVFRYEWHDLSYYKTFFPGVKIYENNIDYGFSLDAEFKKLSINLEIVGRSSRTEVPAGTSTQGQQLFSKETNSDIQYMGTVTYSLTDQIVLSYNLGKKFEPILNPTNTLVSFLGLNFGFGTPTKSDLNLSDK